MATGALTIAIPAAAPPIPELSIVFFEPGGMEQDSTGWATAGTPSQWGTTPITGPAYNGKYGGSVAAHLSQSEMVLFRALARWQDRQLKGLDAPLALDSPFATGQLKITDETQFLDAEPAPHSRTLVAALNPTWNAGWEYGYGIFAAKVQPAGITPLEGSIDGEPAWLVAFTWVEV